MKSRLTPRERIKGALFIIAVLAYVLGMLCLPQYSKYISNATDKVWIDLLSGFLSPGKVICLVYFGLVPVSLFTGFAMGFLFNPDTWDNWYVFRLAGIFYFVFTLIMTLLTPLFEKNSVYLAVLTFISGAAILSLVALTREKRRGSAARESQGYN